VGGRYTGTPRDCYSCHQANYAATTNPNHQAAGFPTQCQSCHTTTAWRPASFDHDGRYFPIYSGKHRGEWSSCSECHVSSGNYKAFECIFCHEHSTKGWTTTKVGGYAYQAPRAMCRNGVMKIQQAAAVCRKKDAMRPRTLRCCLPWPDGQG
jgi:hypothetical protein